MEKQTIKYSKKKQLKPKLSNAFKSFLLTIWDEICLLPQLKIFFVTGCFKAILMAFKGMTLSDIKKQTQTLNKQENKVCEDVVSQEM
ncbi:MAG: hypothetical protein ACOX6H_01450 [Christensenellales bacterium]|jgi:hypothetical protein